MSRLSRPEDILGLDEIIRALEARANTAGGKTAIESIKPAATIEQAERALGETQAMIALMANRPDFDIEPCGDTMGLLDRARKARVLTGPELRMFVPLLRNSERLGAVFAAEGIAEGHPLWTPIPAVHGMAELLGEALDDDGQVRPEATPRIEKLHKALNSLRRSIREKAEALLRDKGLSPMLQDEYVTLRDNRFVLPIKAEHKSHVEGIIHDSSNSGQTFFIEPRALVELNNRLRTVEMELADEIEKLLTDLSRMLAEEAEAIEAIYHAVVRLDSISARARLAADLNCSRPVFGGRLALKGAFNPLMALEGKAVVANDIETPQGARVLMISGPNTGGKTVALKTVGLTSLMARMGLFIAAGEGSVTPFHSSVWADIGDSQSIAEDLSTFSAHLVKINEILVKAGAGSLALLDELMVSTDPKEGSALAAAVLDRLIEKGVDVVVTTHFNELKLLGQSQPAYYNVSMEFDSAEGRPTYRMLAGVPGASSALAVAERLGMDRGVIAAARARIEGGDERIERLLDDLSRQKAELEKARREAQAAMREAARARDEAEKFRADMEARKAELAKTAKRKLSADIAAARREIQGMVEEARESAEKEAAAKAAAGKLADMAARAREAGAPREKTPRGELKAGDEVYVIPLERRGKLVSNPAGGRAEVAFGTMRVTVDLENVVGLGEAEEKQRQPAFGLPVFGGAVRAAEEIDVRGERVDDALEKVERFLDAAMKAGRERGRIIHGKGTGALRAAIRDYLAASPYVESFKSAEHSEGGDGVTCVVMKE